MSSAWCILSLGVLLLLPASRGHGDQAVSKQLYVTDAKQNVSSFAGARLEGLLADTFTDSCRKKVTDSFVDHVKSFVEEKPFPFQTTGFRSHCDPKGAQGAPVYRPASHVRIAYVLLVHEKPAQAKRIITALQEPHLHTFVVHVDGKAPRAVMVELHAFSRSHSNVHLMNDNRRMNISWGGFNIVQATLNGIQSLFELKADFDWVVNLSGYTYPLVSNARIRESLAKLSVDTNLMEIKPNPSEPAPDTVRPIERTDALILPLPLLCAAVVLTFGVTMETCSLFRPCPPARRRFTSTVVLLC